MSVGVGPLASTVDQPKTPKSGDRWPRDGVHPVPGHGWAPPTPDMSLLNLTTALITDGEMEAGGSNQQGRAADLLAW